MIKRILIDSCVWIAAFYKKDKNHNLGKAFLEWLNEQNNLEIIITDFIIAETLNYLRKKARDQRIVKEIIETYFDDEKTEIFFTQEEQFHGALDVFQKYKKLSFVDSTIVISYFNLKPDYLLSYDSGFNVFKNIIRYEYPQ